MAAHGRMESVAAYQGCSQSARCSVSHPIRSNPRLVGPGNPLPRDRRRSSLFPTRNESPYLCFFLGLISTAPFVRSNRGLNHETRDVAPFFSFLFLFFFFFLLDHIDQPFRWILKKRCRGRGVAFGLGRVEQPEDIVAFRGGKVSVIGGVGFPCN